MKDRTHPEPGHAFAVDPFTLVLGGIVERYPRFWKWLGNLETRILSKRLCGRLDRPIYIAGLPRAGSTLLLEMLAWHPRVTTHRYQDFPMLHVPCFWNRFLDFAPRTPPPPAERAHQDGILVNSESPEAFEEVLWMAFFPNLHDPAQSAVLDGSTSQPEFEAFYLNHVRKLLLVRNRDRYLAKGNYNVTRLEYLLRLFPDARLVIPVRDPVWHVASLMKQHRLFGLAQAANPPAIAHLRRAGHFEFGRERRPINAADTAAVEAVLACWKQGDEVAGWARYWNHVYGYLVDRLAANRALARAALVVQYEALCETPLTMVCSLFLHCGLDLSVDLLTRAVARVRFPNYYAPQFTAEERETIERHTRATAERLGVLARNDFGEAS